MAQPQLHGVREPVALVHPDRHDTCFENFDEFFKAHYRLTVRTVMCAGATLQEAEDAVLEAMFLACRRFPTLENPAGWVRRVALRLYIRRAQRDRELRRRDLSATDLPPLRQPEDGDLFRLVLAVLRSLPPTQRVVMALTIDGYSPREIASLTGSSSDNVRSNLRHARNAMAAALVQRGGWNG